MPHAVRPPGFRCCRAGFTVACCLGLAVALAAPQPAVAASLTARDALILIKVLGFLEPAPADGTIAILYGLSVASKADAEEIAGLFGAGLSIRGGTFTTAPVDAAAFGDGAGYIAVIVAAGGPTEVAMLAARAHKILCITASLADVRAGHCVMAIRSEPNVVITVNRAAAVDVGVRFTTALAMLIDEI